MKTGKGQALNKRLLFFLFVPEWIFVVDYGTSTYAMASRSRFKSISDVSCVTILRNINTL